MMNLDTKVQFIKGVGPKMGAKLGELGVECVRDLLWYFPRDYRDYTKIEKIGDLGRYKIQDTPLRQGYAGQARYKQILNSNGQNKIPRQARNDIVGKLIANDSDQLINGFTDNYTISGNVVGISNKRTKRRRFTVTEAVVEDGTGSIKVVWFNQPYLSKMLRAGSKVILNGNIKHDFYSNMPVMESPQRADRPKIVPVYPETAGITSYFIAKILKAVSCQLLAVREHLPEGIIKKNKLMGIGGAIETLHQPENIEKLEKAKRRMAFDELFLIALRSQIAKAEIEKESAPRIEIDEEELKKFVSGLPFTLTDDQRRASWRIIRDLAGGDIHRLDSLIEHRKAKSSKLLANSCIPMNRLLNGDVGSGKTVVAAFAAYVTFKSGFRTLIMAPTAILASQHFNTLNKILSVHGIDVGLMTSSQKIKVDAQVLVGTHALIQDKVDHKNIGLVVVDEQHRFGVNQRAKIGNITHIELSHRKGTEKESQESRISDGVRTLRTHTESSDKNQEKLTADSPASPAGGSKLKVGLMPHFLSMTATPIPRTMQLALFGDLDISVIREMPKGRKIIKTRFVDEIHRAKAYQFIKKQIEAGRQAFVICPLIEEKERNVTHTDLIHQKDTDNDAFKDPNSWQLTANSLFDLDRKSVVKEYQKLDKEVFPDLKIGMLHGRMKAKEKEKVMAEFVASKLDILVSTSVVEVGVDIPNATIMMIEDAERFGLSQMHQFRGRVGRGEHQSYCFLFSNTQSEKAKRRLETLERVSDGFELAEEDLVERGPGEIYGTMQSGLLDFKFADFSNIELITQASESAEEIIEKDQKLVYHIPLKEKLGEFLEKSHME